MGWVFLAFGIAAALLEVVLGNVTTGRFNLDAAVAMAVIGLAACLGCQTVAWVIDYVRRRG